MKVKYLIAELKKCDPDAHVFMQTDEDAISYRQLNGVDPDGFVAEEEFGSLNTIIIW